MEVLAFLGLGLGVGLFIGWHAAFYKTTRDLEQFRERIDETQAKFPAAMKEGLKYGYITGWNHRNKDIGASPGMVDDWADSVVANVLSGKVPPE